MLILVIAIILLVFTTISWFFWSSAKFEWLNKITTLLVLSLPFERIPSLQVAGVNLRISQILVLVGFWVLAVLFFRKDEKLFKVQFNSVFYLLILFLILSLSSWFFIIDDKRFLTTEIATVICFGALFLIANFSENIYEKLDKLNWILMVVALFGLYQFIGDVIGLPNWLTGLREHYTKKVFGIPRVHGTALEPLYFAGMLYLPIFLNIVKVFLKKSESLKIFNFKYSNFDLFILFTVVFLMTFSKSAIIALLITLIALIYFLNAKSSYLVKFFGIIKSHLLKYKYIILLGTGLIILNGSIRTGILNVMVNTVDTILGTSPSAGERSQFISAALHILPNNIIFGIGSGQFGAWAKYLLFSDDSYLIVNNVYLEVWLEHGLLALIVFLLIIFKPVLINIKKLITVADLTSPNSISRLVLSLSLISYYIQWNTFSPIFIMPIFILLGLLYRLEKLD